MSAKPKPTKNTRGGRRKGAGRKSTYPGLILRTHSVRLSDAEANYCRYAGNGNLSAGLRSCIEKALYD